MSSDAVVVAIGDHDRLLTPMVGLRFIEREGKRILQQAWQWQSSDRKTGGYEWRDIPLEANP